MQVFSDIDELRASGIAKKGTAVAIGKFDGVHPGHRKLLSEIKKEKGKGLSSLVFTFERSVGDLFSGTRSPVITTNEEKIRIFEEEGIDLLYIMPVDHHTVSIEPESFVRDILAEGLSARMIAAGPDLSFGDGGRGDMKLLMRLSDELSMDVREIEKVRYEGEEISSTLIRDAILEGDMERTSGMLGRPYSIRGEVIRGKQLGRKIGMPTANTEFPEEKILPPKGVYFSRVYLKDRILKGITNIGIRPTVSDGDRVNAETHIFDHEGDIYGETIKVELLKYHRGEKRFDDIEKLKKQMYDDSIKALTFFRETEKS